MLIDAVPTVQGAEMAVMLIPYVGPRVVVLAMPSLRGTPSSVTPPKALTFAMPENRAEVEPPVNATAAFESP